jgi:hypothetical protein
MSDSKMRKIGELKIVTGEYQDKDGKTKKRYQSVGALFGTPHHSRLSIKFYATAFSDERWANVYYDEGAEPHFGDTTGGVERTPVAEDIASEDIPF